MQDLFFLFLTYGMRKLINERILYMATINILKDGTIVEDMSTVTVPDKIMRNILAIYQNREKNNPADKKKGVMVSK